MANDSDELQGQLPGELSEKGIAQAHALARALSAHQFDVIYSTDLKRGLDTAKIIAGFHGVPLIAEPLLRERNFGIYQGTNRTKFYAYERSLADPFSNRPDKGEAFIDVYKRTELFVKKVKEEHFGQSLLIVSHGDLTRMCLGVLQNLSVLEASRLRQSNGCINVLEIDENSKCSLIQFNDISHLSPDLVSNNKTDL